MREGKPKVVISTTPRNKEELKKIKANKNTHVTIGSTYENAANLSDIFINEVIKPYEDTRIGQQELHAEILEDVEGALWNYVLIDSTKINKNDLPDLKYITVGVDPAGSSKGAEIGIVAAGVDEEGQGYVIADSSMHGSPDKWASEAVRLYKYLNANEMVVETNYGGEMAIDTIRTRDTDRVIKFTDVKAGANKAARAQPIVAYYEQGSIHHAGSFAGLENQMCTWSPLENDDSPDRIDALVWAFTRLKIKKRPGKPGIRSL